MEFKFGARTTAEGSREAETAAAEKGAGRKGGEGEGIAPEGRGGTPTRSGPKCLRSGSLETADGASGMLPLLLCNHTHKHSLNP